MSIRVVCPGCGARYKVADEMAGKTRPCSCGELLVAKASLPVVLEVPVEEAEELAQSEPVVELRTRKPIGPFGVGSFAFSMMALLLCWIPFVNLASFPLAVIGSVLALMGIGLSLVGKRSSLTWPASSLVMCLLAVFISHHVWLGMWMALDRVTGVVDRVEKAATKAVENSSVRIEVGPSRGK